MGVAIEYRLTKHVKDRWRERGDGRDLDDVIKDAVPFGGQYGDSVLLRSGNHVFVLRKPASIVTVLTLDQALVNMQRAGIRMKWIAETPVAAPLKPPPSVPKRRVYSKNERSVRLNQIANDVISADNERLAELVESDDHRPLAQYILGMRLKTERLHVACEKNNRERQFFCNELKKLLSPEQMQEVYDRLEDMRATQAPTGNATK